jgi:tetratricopeptide (TPR) repeat protein
VHELLRQYAEAELADAGRYAETREAHAQAFTSRLLEHAEALESNASIETRAYLALDSGNLRSALEWAIGHWPEGRVEPWLLPASALWTMSVDPVAVEVWTALDRVARERDARPPGSSHSLPWRCIVAPHLAFALAIVDENEQADVVAGECLPILEAAGRQVEAAMCRMVLGIDRCNRNENEAAIEPLEAADAVLRSQRFRLLRGELLTWLGWARLMTDDAQGARTAFDLAYAICDELGEPVSTAFALSKLGLLEDEAGNYGAALERHLAAFARFDAAGNDGGVGYALSRASFSASCLGRYQAALEFAQAAYEGFAELNHHWGLIVVTGRLAYAYLGLDRPADAERWALHSVQLARGSDRIGGLHALGAVAGAMARRGDLEGVRLMRAILGDGSMPAFLAVQLRAELEHAETRYGKVDEGESPDLDATISRLLERPHPAPVLR